MTTRSGCNYGLEEKKYKYLCTCRMDGSIHGYRDVELTPQYQREKFEEKMKRSNVRVKYLEQVNERAGGEDVYILFYLHENDVFKFARPRPEFGGRISWWEDDADNFSTETVDKYARNQK